MKTKWTRVTAVLCAMVLWISLLPGLPAVLAQNGEETQEEQTFMVPMEEEDAPDPFELESETEPEELAAGAAETPPANMQIGQAVEVKQGGVLRIDVNDAAFDAENAILELSQSFGGVMLYYSLENDSVRYEMETYCMQPGYNYKLTTYNLMIPVDIPSGRYTLTLDFGVWKKGKVEFNMECTVLENTDMVSAVLQSNGKNKKVINGSSRFPINCLRRLWRRA